MNPRHCSLLLKHTQLRFLTSRFLLSPVITVKPREAVLQQQTRAGRWWEADHHTDILGSRLMSVWVWSVESPVSTFTTFPGVVASYKDIYV